MRTALCISVLLLAVPAVADQRDAELARLKQRIAVLEAENQNLRERLAQIAALTSELPAEPLSDLSIVVASDDWGDAVKADVGKVLMSAATPIWTAAGKPPLHRIDVVQSDQGPLVAFKRGPGNTYKVLLHVQGRLWAKFSYQFSHEMCHILANYRDVPNPQKWLEESICECASLYSLRQMGKSWKTSPPYPNWASYGDSLTDYADDRINKATPMTEDNLAAWYATHQDKLAGNGTNRDLNLVVAVKLLPIFEQTPDAWKAIRTMNLGDPSENLSLRRYLTSWHTRAAEQEKSVVRQLAELFAIEIPAQ